jgi:hypothetical protein
MRRFGYPEPSVELPLAEPKQVRQSLPQAASESAAEQMLQLALQLVRRRHGRACMSSRRGKLLISIPAGRPMRPGSRS